jgi:hypothetical protein
MFEPGPVEIWYWRSPPLEMPPSGAALERMSFLEKPPSVSDIQQRYVMLGSIKGPPQFLSREVYLEWIYRIMQGEEWSPNGEGRELILSKGLTHTSMTVADAVHLPDGTWWAIAPSGWKQVQ